MIPIYLIVSGSETLHRKQKIEQLKTRSEFGCSRKMSSIYSKIGSSLVDENEAFTFTIYNVK
jgi:hypothetical protein